MSDARAIIQEAIKRRTVLRVAEASGVHFTRIYAFMKGSDMSPENTGKVRAVLSEIPDEIWLDLCAPAPQPTDAA